MSTQNKWTSSTNKHTNEFIDESKYCPCFNCDFRRGCTVECKTYKQYKNMRGTVTKLKKLIEPKKKIS